MLFLPVPSGAQAERHAYTIAHVLRYATSDDISSLNPHLTQQGTVFYLASLTMAWLVKYDAHNRPVPELATAVPSQANGGVSRDGKTITYHLRRGVVWSDGKPFTSADVAFSVDVVRDPANNELSHAAFDDIARVLTPDPWTVVFHLREPLAGAYVHFFSSGGANPCVLPKHLFTSTKINESAYNALPVGIGPFMYTSWKRGYEVELAANPSYFRGRPKLDRIIFRIVPDRNTVLTLLATHELDLWLPVAAGYANRVGALPGIDVLRQPSYIYDHIDMNFTRPALADPAVREALRYATDRATLLEKVRHGFGVLQEGAIAPDHPLFDRSIPLVPFDLAKANELLDRAGWVRGTDGIRAKNGVRLAFEWASSAGAPDLDVQLELIRQWWQQIGVSFEVHRYESSVLFGPPGTGGVLATGHYDISTFAWYDTPDGDLVNIYACDRVPPAGSNYERFCDPALDGTFTVFGRTYDPARRRALASAIQRRMVKDVTTIVLDVRQDIYAYNSDLKNFHPNQITPFDSMLDVDI